MVDHNKEDRLLQERDAQRLVQDETVKRAFERVKTSYLDGWSRTAPHEVQKREQAYMLYKAVSDIWATLERDAKAAHVRDLKAQKENPNG